MQNNTFDTNYAHQLEQAISLEFGCRVSEIVSLRDSLVKKVIVFVLFKSEKYNTRIIGLNYHISYLYVPTVVAEIEYMIKTVPDFESKINSILKLIPNV